MHKAITVIQLKLEAEIISRRPEFGMENRKLLHLVDFERGVFVYEGKEYPLRDVNFPTVDPADPYRLSDEERELMPVSYTHLLDVEIMIIAESIHDNMRTRSAVVYIAHDMQRVDGQTLDKVAHRHKMCIRDSLLRLCVL